MITIDRFLSFLSKKKNPLFPLWLIIEISSSAFISSLKLCMERKFRNQRQCVYLSAKIAEFLDTQKYI